ncbi:MAG: hypothetical protein ACFFCX_17595 [Candidatus Sifarchaeia archaeon]
MDLWQIITLVHIIGIALGVGGASIKLVLFMKSYYNKNFTPAYTVVAEPISQLIFLGMILLTVSGIGYALVGYPEGSSLLVKHVLVVLLWVVGPLISKVYGPRFITLAPKPSESPTSEFLQVRKQLLVLEVLGTVCFYAVSIIGIIM